MAKQILAIIPAYNEALNIKQTCESISRLHPEIDILVVNDCSTDNTKEIINSLDNINIISCPINLGIGSC